MIEDLFRNPLHLLVLLAVLVMVFGTSKLADAGKHIGRSIKEFKREVNAPDDPPAATATATEGTLRCPACGEAVPAGASFCLRCGHQLQVPQARHCTNCRAELAPNARFCIVCGHSVELVPSGALPPNGIGATSAPSP